MKTIYLKNVSILKLEELNKSYSTKTERLDHNLATICGNWIELYTFAPAGTFIKRFNMTAKKFIEIEKSTEIKAPTFIKHYKRLESEAKDRKKEIEAEQVKQANEQTERVAAAKVAVLDRKEWLSSYMVERGLTLNDLSKHKTANLYAFKLAHRFDVKPSDLRNAFKELFRTNN